MPIKTWNGKGRFEYKGKPVWIGIDFASNFEPSCIEYFYDDAITIEEEEKGMNYTTAVFLTNENVRAISVKYEDEHKERTFKAFDLSLKEGDYVVIPTETRWKMTVAKVVAVDVPVDYDSTIKMDWIISKVDDSGYKSTIEQEKKIVDEIKEAVEKKKRVDLRETLLAHTGDKLKALQITRDVPAADTAA